MPVRETEAIILRTYPLKEADKIVSFFSRDAGRVRGVARNARRSVRRFGAALELLSHVRLRYFQQETRDLVRLDSCELLQSFFETQRNYEASVGFCYIAEVCEQLLPEGEANDPFFRLVLLVANQIRRTEQIWQPLTYFNLWAVKLAGFLPQMDVCCRCGANFEPGEQAWFRPEWEGLGCEACRDEGSWRFSADSRAVARTMLVSSLEAVPPEGWSKSRAEDLRKFLGQQIEQHIERKLITRPQLEALP